VDSFGAYLKREREMRSVTLREIGQATKVSIQSLEALEDENFSLIGAEIFIRGFIRSYARYLGMDVEDALLRYDEFRQNQDPQNEAAKRGEELFLDQGKGGFPWAKVSIVLLLLVGVGLWFARVELPESLPPATAEVPRPAVEATQSFPEAPAPVTEAASEALETSAEPLIKEASPVKAAAAARTDTGHQVNLVVIAQRVSYVKLWIDEDNPVERMMQAGTEWHVGGRERIEILTGNAGGVSLQLNGRELPALGPAGGVRRQVITRDGVATP
jgi:cytoskeleton protein RodZ